MHNFKTTENCWDILFFFYSSFLKYLKIRQTIQLKSVRNGTSLTKGCNKHSLLSVGFIFKQLTDQ